MVLYTAPNLQHDPVVMRAGAFNPQSVLCWINSVMGFIVTYTLFDIIKVKNRSYFKRAQRTKKTCLFTL